MRIRNTLQGLVLMLSSTKIFHPEKHFQRKRIAVVGPADSAFEKENGKFIEGFDYIIRINKAPHSLTAEKQKFVGSRTDILFHSFFESNKDGGGGPIDWNLFKNQGIGFVINPNNDKKGLLAHLNYYKRNLNPKTTYILPWSLTKKIRSKLGKWIPTGGFTALYTALDSGCKEVYITGFTFFKTPYADNYRDELKDTEKNNDFIKRQGFHNPDLELKAFMDKMKEASRSGTNVLLDSSLESIVRNHKSIENGE